jgi:hypothetical protein
MSFIKAKIRASVYFFFFFDNESIFFFSFHNKILLKIHFTLNMNISVEI